jgi:hypothetical protein
LPSRLPRRHGVQGWPAIPRARRYGHLNRNRQNIISRLPVVLASSRPIKGQARVLQHRQKNKGEGKGQQARRKIEIDISSNHPCPHFPLFETWARHPLLHACNPYTSTSVQGNTNFSLPTRRRAFFCPNQDKPPCVLLASPSRKGTRSIYSLV